MSTALTVQDISSGLIAVDIERVLILGDLSKLSPDQRLSYYNRVCQSIGINPLTRPFEYISLNGKLVLYAKRDCTDQLRKNHAVSISNLRTEKIADVYVVKVTATDKTGRTDESTGAVNIGRLAGEALANAMMKAETKAKRRVTLSICGLGFFDETEVEGLAEVDPTLASQQTLQRTQRELGTLRPSAEPNRGHGNEGLKKVEEDVICNTCRVKNGHADKCPNNPAKRRGRKPAATAAEPTAPALTPRQRWENSPGHRPEAHISFDQAIELFKLQDRLKISEETMKDFLLRNFELEHRYLIRKEDIEMVMEAIRKEFGGVTAEDIQY